MDRRPVKPASSRVFHLKQGNPHAPVSIENRLDDERACHSMLESRLKYRATLYGLSSVVLIVLCGCGGGGSSSSLPTGSVQLTVQEAGPGGGTVSSNPAGINCGQACTASFSSGTQVALTASPATNSSFAGWSGACSGTGVCKVTLMQNTSVMANFSTSPALTVALGGNGTGSVASSPSGINCGQTCSASFDLGTSVTLTATAATNSTFAGWNGGSCGSSPTCLVTLNGSEKVTAIFNVIQSEPVLSVIPGGTGTGTVTSSPSGINCGTTCSASFNAGTQVTLSETASAASYFAGWSVTSCGNNATCTVTLNASQQVTATFNVSSVLTVTLGGTGTGTVTSNPGGISCPPTPTCGASFPPATQVTLSEVPGANSTFAGWSVSTCSASS